MARIEAGFVVMQAVLVRLALKVGRKDEGVVVCSLMLFIFIGFIELILPLNLLQSWN